MGVKLLPPIIEGKIPAQVGDWLNIPFEHSRGVGKNAYKKFLLKIKTTSTGQQIGIVDSGEYKDKDGIIKFNLKDTGIILTPGQYYKIQLAYQDNEDIVGYYSTIGIFKYTTKPYISISSDEGELTTKEVYSGSNEFQGIYKQQAETIFNKQACEEGIKIIAGLREERKAIINSYLSNIELTSKEIELKEIEQKLDFQKEAVNQVKKLTKQYQSQVNEYAEKIKQLQENILGNSKEDFSETYNNFITKVLEEIEKLNAFLNGQSAQQELNNELSNYMAQTKEAVEELISLADDKYSDSIDAYKSARFDEIAKIESAFLLDRENAELNLIPMEKLTESLAEYEKSLNMHLDVIEKQIKDISEEEIKMQFQSYIDSRREEVEKIESFFDVSSSKEITQPEIEEILDTIKQDFNNFKILFNNAISQKMINHISSLKVIIEDIDEAALDFYKNSLYNLNYKDYENWPQDKIINEWKEIFNIFPYEIEQKILNIYTVLQSLNIENNESEPSFVYYELISNSFNSMKNFNNDIKKNIEDKNIDYTVLKNQIESFIAVYQAFNDLIETYSEKIQSYIEDYYNNSFQKIYDSFINFSNRFYNTVDNTNPINIILENIKTLLESNLYLSDYKDYLNNKDQGEQALQGKIFCDMTNYKYSEINSPINFKEQALSIINDYDSNAITSLLNKIVTNENAKEEKEKYLETYLAEKLKPINEQNETVLNNCLIGYIYSFTSIIVNNRLEEYKNTLKSIFNIFEGNRDISIAEASLDALSDIIFSPGLYSLEEVVSNELSLIESNYETEKFNLDYANSLSNQLDALNKKENDYPLNKLKDLISEDLVKDDNKFNETLQNYLYYSSEFDYLDKKVLFNNISDTSEKVYSYRFDVYQGENLFESSGDQIHNAVNDDKANESSDKFVLTKELEKNIHYTIQYTITTNNNLVVSSPRYLIAKMGEKEIDFPIDIIIPNEYSNNTEEVEKALLNKEEGFFSIGLKLRTGNAIKGQFRILRADSLSNFAVWNEMTKIRIDTYVDKDKYHWLFDDFTVQHGVTYKYAIQQFGGKIFSKKKESREVLCDFIDTFLYDGKRQLKIQFNPKVSSFKNVLLESKLDTIGGVYPFMFRNARTKYKEIPISGMISYLMDNNQMFLKDEDLQLASNTDIRYTTLSSGQQFERMERPFRSTDLTSENILSERIFKLEVLDWLTNGEPKIFRSPTEGNYIVRLINCSLSPNDTLGRMLHTFSATGYEIAEFNYDNLQYYNFINIHDFEEQIEISHHYVYKFNGEESGTKLTFQPTIFARLVDLEPWSKFKLIYGPGDEKEIQVGLSGCYNIPQEGLIGIELLSTVKEGMLEIDIKNNDNFDMITKVIKINNGLTPAEYKLKNVISKDYYSQFGKEITLEDLIYPKQIDNTESEAPMPIFLNDFFKDEINGNTIIQRKLEKVLFLRIESKPIYIVNSSKKLIAKTTLYGNASNECKFDINQLNSWKNNYFYYKIYRKATQEEYNQFKLEYIPIDFALDCAIIEGNPYKVPVKLPSGYIEFDVNDFDENFKGLYLGPGVYADIVYRVIEETYELIDNDIKVEKINKEKKEEVL